MAQWKSRPYEIIFGVDEALRLLRSAADKWAAHGRNSLNIDEALSVVLSALSARYHADSRPLELRLKGFIPPPQMSCPRGVCSGEPPGLRAAIAELQEMMSAAADLWVDGYAERPRTAEVLREMLVTLFRYHLIVRPPPADLESA